MSSTCLIFGKNWMDSIVREIKTLDPYQVTIVKNQTKNDFELTKIVSENIPTVSLNLEKMVIISDNASARAFSRSSNSAVYLIPYQVGNNDKDIDLEHLKYFFHYFAKLSPRLTRPKCLIIVSSQGYILNDSFKTALYSAWGK